jgi:hypothetical protein
MSKSLSLSGRTPFGRFPIGEDVTIGGTLWARPGGGQPIGKNNATNTTTPTSST